jgi:autocrine motility factor receptor
LKLVKSIYNFDFNLTHSLHLIEAADNDQRMINKLYVNFSLDISYKAVSIAFCGLLMYGSGAFTLSFFPMAQIFMVQHLYKLVTDISKEINKLRQFKMQLADIDSSYPIVEYANDSQEECAICKESMVKARKLPCAHAFHWFCIVQLIESGSKNCPICRAEFHNHRHQANHNRRRQRAAAAGAARWWPQWLRMPRIQIRFQR